MTDKPTPPTFTEAPASWNVRYIMNGYDCQLTLRGESGADLLSRTAKALDWLQTSGAQPTAAKPSTNGSSKPAEVPQDDPGYCKIHHCEMKRHEKDGRSWYSHRLESGDYCKGK